MTPQSSSTETATNQEHEHNTPHHRTNNTPTTTDTNSWIGDEFTNDKPPHTLRITFQNINGIGTTHYKQQLTILANDQIALDIDILGMTEHCLHIHHRDTLKNVQQSIRGSTQEKTFLQINASKSLTTQRYLPGGTAILMIGNTVGRIEPQGRGGDRMGRWSFVQLRRKHQQPVTIITAYQVNKNPTNTIGNTAWHQQRLALDAAGKHELHPRTAFINDMITFIQELKTTNHDIILGGDFNDTIQRNNSGLLKLIMHTGLVDIWNHRQPTHQTFPTYARGTERIDTVLCTPNMLTHIQKMGYSPFQWITNSDHRGIFLDINYKNLFDDDQPNTILDYSSRGIRSNDIKRCQLFITQFYNHMQSNNAEHQLQAILSNNATIDDVEKFDTLIGQAGDSAEKHCRKRRPEFYSVKIHQLRIQMSIAKCHYNNVKFLRPDNRDSLQHRLDRANITLTLHDDIDQARHTVQEISQQLREAAMTSYDLREQELKCRINAKHEPGTETYTKRLQALQKNEASRKAWSTMKFLKTGQNTRQSLNRIDIPDSWPNPTDYDPSEKIQDPKQCTSWKTITNPDDIEYYIRIRNRGHFGQAHGTPFTERPLLDEINWAADTITSSEILQGHKQIDTIASIPQCQALLDACHAATELNVLPADININDFKGKIKKWRESTTTSPSGRHLGRYKALLTNMKHTNTDNDTPTIPYEEQQTFIITSIIAVINFCIQRNHTLLRWKKVINTMIFKESGNYKIHRLRVIHIYEADFNLLLAIKWRQLLQYANMHGLINSGLFGGRPGCEAQSLVFLEELKYNTSYCSRRTLFNFDNDATSCYDRIIVALASLINWKYGLHQRVVALHANTLQQAQFHLRTINGISDQSYSHSIQFPIYGSGQGSGNSPAIWLFISSTLCDVHNQISYGASFTTPQGTDTVKLSMVAFVDDSTGTYNDFRPQSEPNINEMLPHAQHDCQTWNDLLWCSGGKLELPKCSYHVLRFEFLPNGIPKPVKDCSDLKLSVVDAETGNTIQIPPKQTDEPHKTLGHWKAPTDPKATKQLQTLKTKAKELALMIGTGALSRHGADLAYHAMYCTSLKYVLPQCFFSPVVLDKAEAKSLPIVLSKQGFNRNTAKPIRFCPKSYAGCGMIPWKVLQGEGQLTLFVKHWRTNTIISKMLRMALAWAQWNAGTGTSILSEVHDPLPYLEARWITSLRNSLAMANIFLTLDRPYVVNIERHGDVFLMDWIRTMTTYNERQMQILNCCRLHIHVTTISELLDTNGRNILPHMFNCVRPKWFNKRQYMPIQPRPSPYQIRTLWKPLCQQIKQHISQRLLTLRNWTGKDANTRPYRLAYTETLTKPPTHYHWIQDSYWTLEPYLSTVPGYLISGHSTEWKPTNTAIPISTSLGRPTLRGIVYRLYPTTDDTTLQNQPAPVLREDNANASRNAQDTFQAYLSTLPTWQQSLLTETKFNLSPNQLKTQASNYTGKMTFFTDYHFLNDISCFSWIFFQQNGEILASGCGPCPGPPERTRADAWSLLSSIQFIHHVWKMEPQDDLPYPQIQFVNRNKRIIRRIQELNQYGETYCNSTLDRDWDIIRQIVETERLTAHWKPTWIPMHQFLANHKQSDIRELPKLQQRLFDTKNIAKKYLPTVLMQSKHSPFLPASRCLVSHKLQTIHGRYHTAYRDAVSLPNLFQYLGKKHNWNDNTVTKVHWRWFQHAVRRHSHASKNHLTKLVYNQLATQDQKHITGGKAWVHNKCPYCPDTNETFQHLLRCQHPIAATFRSNLLKIVTSTCHARRAPGIIRTTLLSWISSWMNNEIPPLETIDQRLHQLHAAQSEIGWDLLVRGFFAEEWNHIAKSYQPTRSKPYNNDFLFPKLITDIWKTQTDFWTAYQKERHTSPSEPAALSATLAELHAQVRHLYSMADKVLQSQRNHYFPDDIDQFLSDRKAPQIQAYIDAYGPAIRMSIRHAKRQAQANTRPLHTYGFLPTSTAATPVVIRPLPVPDHSTLHVQPNPSHRPALRQRILSWTATRLLSSTRPPQQTTTLQTTNSHTAQPHPPPTDPDTSAATPPSTQRAPHHKHSRWRSIDLQRQRFLSFFRR